LSASPSRPVAGGKWLNYCNPTCQGQPEEHMAWTTPTLVEICIGLEINGYLPAEF
jgi:coenzyme PQQ precursor peptide PqqA